MALVTLRQHVETSVLACFGVPAPLGPMGVNAGTAQREALRRFWTLMSTLIRKRVNLKGSSTPTSWGARFGIDRQEPVRMSVRGAVVKAVSPAKRGPSVARSLDDGEHTRTLVA
ncbi:MAG: hypothetical protein OXH69_04200 [Acidobacteria bacterium]|nr:hypothetical protein [Acidobacteriota bacterium]